MEEWKEYKLGDILQISSGFAYKGKDIGYGDNSLLGMGCVSFNEKFLRSGVRCYNGDCPDRYCVKPDDMVLATRQQSDNLPILGMPAIIPDDLKGRKVIVGANLYKVENTSDFDTSYIYWLLKSPSYVDYIRSCQTGTTVRMITKANIESYTFRAPSKKNREKIVAILSSLDDKIEVNRRINDNLEQQAQALYKSWFVDFEPFKDGGFVESELGMIPKGWRVGTLEDLIEIKYGKDHKKLNDGDIPVYGSGGIMRYVDKSLFTGESVLIPRKGTLNNVMYVNRDFWTVDTMFFSKMKTLNSAIFVYLFLSKKDLASMNSGSAVPSMTIDILNRIQLSIPNEKIFEGFNNVVSSIYSQLSHNIEEIAHLTTLRDTLLPKLMSGELSVDDVLID